jgi:peptidoglycan/LPS O-acetylase OafA/YrhL
LLNHLLPHDGRPGHQPELDGFRGLAVAIVLLAHSSNAGYPLFGVVDFHHYGSVGVYLFFVLSAYLIDRQIINALEMGHANLGFWIRFALRRVLRIYPLYLVALLLNWALSARGLPSPIHSASDVLRHLALLEGRQVFWTIPVEFLYYILSPLVLALLWPLYRRRPVLAIAVLATALASLWYLRQQHVAMPIFLRFLPVLGCGTLLALTQRRLRLPGGIGLALLALILTTVPTFARLIYGTSSFHGHSFTLAYGIAWALILYQALNHEIALSALGRWLPLRALGALSFSVYLLHKPVLALAQHYMPDPWALPAFLAGTLAVSLLTYTFVERPLAQLKFRP